MIGMSQLAADRLLVALLVTFILLLWGLQVVAKRQGRPRPPYRPTAGRRSHAVTIRGVRPCLRMRGYQTPAQQAVVRRLLEWYR